MSMKKENINCNTKVKNKKEKGITFEVHPKC